MTAHVSGTEATQALATLLAIAAAQPPREAGDAEEPDVWEPSDGDLDWLADRAENRETKWMRGDLP